jgi:hypothetical protein
MKSKKNLFKKIKKYHKTLFLINLILKNKIIKKNPDLDMLGWVG